MAKNYFIIGHIASGHRQLSGDLIDSLRIQDSSNTIFCQDLGKDQNIGEYGTTPAGAILFEISNMISYHGDVDVFVFTGWQILENIQAIYDEYKDTSTFIFVKAGNPDIIKEYKRSKLRNLTATAIEDAMTRQLSDTDQFFVNNNLTPTWNYVVNYNSFNSDLTVNTTSTVTNQTLSIVGTL